MIIEILVLLFTIFLCFVWANRDRKLFPPGPWDIPLIGSKMISYIDDAAKCRKQYGDLFSTRLGNCRFVYISDYKLTKETYSRPEFSGRIQWSMMHISDREKKDKSSGGIIWSNGEIWQHNRRFLLRHLRDLGMGKSRMEGAILRETEEIIDELESTAGKPTKIPFALNVGILNVVWSLIAGHRYGKEDISLVKKLITSFNDAQETLVTAGLVEFFPILKKLPNFILEKVLSRSLFSEALTVFKDHMQPFIDEHKKNLNSDNPNDLIDNYLIDMEQEEKDNKESLFSEHDLMRNIWDLFIAGMDTTSNTISFFFIYMAKYQEEQKKVQAILDDVVPDGSLPGLEHRDQLVYLDAVLNEVTRMASFACFGVSRTALEDSQINGYLVPKDSILFTCAGSDHYDTRYWNDPHKFDPSRFISEEGKFISQKDGFHPFGMGRRQCLGESLAKMELYLIAAGVLKNFTISPCDGQEADLKPRRLPMMHKPNLEQKIVFKSRN